MMYLVAKYEYAIKIAISELYTYVFSVMYKRVVNAGKLDHFNFLITMKQDRYINGTHTFIFVDQRIASSRDTRMKKKNQKYHKRNTTKR